MHSFIESIVVDADGKNATKITQGQFDEWLASPIEQVSSQDDEGSGT